MQRIIHLEKVVSDNNVSSLSKTLHHRLTALERGAFTENAPLPKDLTANFKHEAAVLNFPRHQLGRQNEKQWTKSLLSRLWSTLHVFARKVGDPNTPYSKLTRSKGISVVSLHHWRIVLQENDPLFSVWACYRKEETLASAIYGTVSNTLSFREIDVTECYKEACALKGHLSESITFHGNSTIFLPYVWPVNDVLTAWYPCKPTVTPTEIQYIFTTVYERVSAMYALFWEATYPDELAEEMQRMAVEMRTGRMMNLAQIFALRSISPGALRLVLEQMFKRPLETVDVMFDSRSPWCFRLGFKNQDNSTSFKTIYLDGEIRLNREYNYSLSGKPSFPISIKNNNS